MFSEGGITRQAARQQLTYRRHSTLQASELSSAGAVGAAIRCFDPVFRDPSKKLHSALLEFLLLVGGQHLSPGEMRYFLSLVGETQRVERLVTKCLQSPPASLLATAVGEEETKSEANAERKKIVDACQAAHTSDDWQRGTVISALLRIVQGQRLLSGSSGPERVPHIVIPAVSSRAAKGAAFAGIVHPHKVSGNVNGMMLKKWPPQEGYTFSCWFAVHKGKRGSGAAVPSASAPASASSSRTRRSTRAKSPRGGGPGGSEGEPRITLFSLYSGRDLPHFFDVNLQSGVISLATGSHRGTETNLGGGNNDISIARFMVNRADAKKDNLFNNQWRHLFVVHKKKPGADTKWVSRILS